MSRIIRGDCPPCGTIAPEGGTIDNGAACLELHGDLEYWRNEPVGAGGSLVWTNATEYDVASNYAIWRMYFAEAGTYALETHVQQPFGESKQTHYHVHHAMGETVVPIDQSLTSGWVSLGEFTFAAATDHFVRIDDNTLTGGPITTGETAGTAGGTDAGSTDDPPDTSPTSDGGPPTTGGSTGTSGATGPGLPADYGDDGCGCRGPSRSPGALALVLLGLGLTRRRRGRGAASR